MGKILDLIKNFIEPRKQQTFEELAVASGISEGDLKQLKNTMEGIDWKSFAREDEEKTANKKTKITKQALNKENISMNINKESSTRNNDEIERET